MKTINCHCFKVRNGAMGPRQEKVEDWVHVQWAFLMKSGHAPKVKNTLLTNKHMHTYTVVCSW